MLIFNYLHIYRIVLKRCTWKCITRKTILTCIAHIIGVSVPWAPKHATWPVDDSGSLTRVSHYDTPACRCAPHGLRGTETIHVMHVARKDARESIAITFEGRTVIFFFSFARVFNQVGDGCAFVLMCSCAAINYQIC